MHTRRIYTLRESTKGLPRPPTPTHIQHTHEHPFPQSLTLSSFLPSLCHPSVLCMCLTLLLSVSSTSLVRNLSQICPLAHSTDLSTDALPDVLCNLSP